MVALSIWANQTTIRRVWADQVPPTDRRGRLEDSPRFFEILSTRFLFLGGSRGTGQFEGVLPCPQSSNRATEAIFSEFKNSAERLWLA